MNGDEFLQTPHAPEAEYHALQSSEGLLRVFRAVVRPVTSFLLAADAGFTQRRPIRSQRIRHDLIGGAVPLRRFLEEFQSNLIVTPLHHEAFEHFVVVVDSPPQVMQFTVDFHENLVQMPPPVA